MYMLVIFKTKLVISADGIFLKVHCEKSASSAPETEVAQEMCTVVFALSLKAMQTQNIWTKIEKPHGTVWHWNNLPHPVPLASFFFVCVCLCVFLVSE